MGEAWALHTGDTESAAGDTLLDACMRLLLPPPSLATNLGKKCSIIQRISLMRMSSSEWLGVVAAAQASLSLCQIFPYPLYPSLCARPGLERASPPPPPPLSDNPEADFCFALVAEWGRTGRSEEESQSQEKVNRLVYISNTPSILGHQSSSLSSLLPSQLSLIMTSCHLEHGPRD